MLRRWKQMSIIDLLVGQPISRTGASICLLHWNSTAEYIKLKLGGLFVSFYGNENVEVDGSGFKVWICGVVSISKWNIEILKLVSYLHPFEHSSVFLFIVNRIWIFFPSSATVVSLHIQLLLVLLWPSSKLPDLWMALLFRGFRQSLQENAYIAATLK
jgi:hypothetical protein